MDKKTLRSMFTRVVYHLHSKTTIPLPLLCTRQVTVQMWPSTGHCRVPRSPFTQLFWVGYLWRNVLYTKHFFATSLIQALKLGWPGSQNIQNVRCYKYQSAPWWNEQIKNKQAYYKPLTYDKLTHTSRNILTQTVYSVLFHPCNNIFGTK